MPAHDAFTRGKALTAFARRCDESLHPGAVFAEAVAGERVDGTRRAQNQAEYDWQRDDKRVACKSAQLTWQQSKAHWNLSFKNVKLRRKGAPEAAFDELLLAAYTPSGVHIFRHDLRTGVTSAGKGTVAMGQEIRFSGPSNEPDWRKARDAILEKMGDRVTFVASAGYDDPRLAAAVEATPLPFTASAYEGVPLADCSGQARGKLLPRLVRKLDERWLHPGATFAEAVAGECVDGKRRAQHMAEYGWRRDGQRVACKSAQLKWDQSKARWWLQFRSVKLPRKGAPEAAFEELLLAAYTPSGVHIFRHDLRAGVSSAGMGMAATGQEIQFYGPSNEPDWRKARDVILEKMGQSCRPLAVVPWELAD